MPKKRKPSLKDLLKLVNSNFPEVEIIDRVRDPLAGIKNVVAYYRESKSDEGKEFNSIDSQKHAVRGLAKREHEKIKAEFADENISGKFLTFKERPQWSAMLRWLKRNCVDAVVMKAVDRFGRDLKSGLDAFEELDETGILLRFADQPMMRPETNEGWQMFVFALFQAEIEVRTISKRTTDALKLRRVKGIHLGERPNHFRVVNKRLVPTPKAVAIATLRAQGESYDFIAREVGVPKKEGWNLCRFLRAEKERRKAQG